MAICCRIELLEFERSQQRYGCDPCILNERTGGTGGNSATKFLYNLCYYRALGSTLNTGLQPNHSGRHTDSRYIKLTMAMTTQPQLDETMMQRATSERLGTVSIQQDLFRSIVEHNGRSLLEASWDETMTRGLLSGRGRLAVPPAVQFVEPSVIHCEPCTERSTTAPKVHLKSCHRCWMGWKFISPTSSSASVHVFLLQNSAIRNFSILSISHPVSKLMIT
jgi:hypothetical protein